VVAIRLFLVCVYGCFLLWWIRAYSFMSVVYEFYVGAVGFVTVVWWVVFVLASFIFFFIFFFFWCILFLCSSVFVEICKPG